MFGASGAGLLTQVATAMGGQFIHSLNAVQLQNTFINIDASLNAAANMGLIRLGGAESFAKAPNRHGSMLDEKDND